MVSIPERFSENRKTVCVMGLGFVGAAMSLAVATAKDRDGTLLYNVIGVDVPNEAGHRKAFSLNSGKFPFETNDKKLIQAALDVKEAGNFIAVTESEYFSYADIVIVDINLDVSYDQEGNPYLNLDMFRGAMHTLGRWIPSSTLVIVETTVPPGTCEKVVAPILKEEFEKRGLDVNDIYIAHSYERVMPGENYFDSIVNYWRVFSGLDEKSAERAEQFLRSVISTEKYPLTRLHKTTATEIAKVLENSYRAVTIAFMEEWGRFAEAVDVDLFEVVNAIRMRPTHSNMRQPGFGVGGYCLTKDPYFAQLAAHDLFGLTELSFPYCVSAVKLNNAMPLVSLDKIEKALGSSLKGKRLLVLGVSYRQDVADTRYSPTEIFAREAMKRGAILDFQDPMVDYWVEMQIPVSKDRPQFTGYDAVVFTVQHKQYADIDFETEKIDEGTLIFDANCVLNEKQMDAIRKRKYVSLQCIGR